MKKFIYIFLFTVGVLSESYGQQEFMITHYMHNGLFLNPAYAGSHEGISASALVRQQWVGVEGAPSLQMVSMHSPITYRNIALGAMIYRDNIGITTETGGDFSYAYRINLTKKLRLSMGLQGMIKNYRVNYSKASSPMFDVGDPSVGSDLSEFKVNFGAGLFLHSERFYFGLSVPRIAHNKVEIADDEGMFNKSVRHYYLSAGYVLEIAPEIYLKPNILIKKSEHAPVQYDLNLNALIRNKVWVGASYRSLESIDGLLGIQVNPQFLVSYAHDFTVNEMNVSSHEIMLSYVFERKNMRIQTPRYF